MSANFLRLIGEVYNGSTSNIYGVRVTANFYDASGGLVGTENGSVWLNYIRPGEKTCFQVFLLEPANWTRYEFERPSFYSSNSPRPMLTIFNDSGTVTGSLDYHILGQVRNDDTVRVNSVKVVGTLYNDIDVPLGCWFDYVGSNDLDPGQVSSFDIGYYGRSWSDVQVYHLQAEGTPQ